MCGSTRCADRFLKATPRALPVLTPRFYFYQDSFWATGDINAVFDQDPQHVAIPQGPVTVKHARIANRPIKEMLGGVEDYVVKWLLEKYYDNDESKVPYIDYIGSVPAETNHTLTPLYGIDITSDKASTTYKFGSSLPPVEEWLETLSLVASSPLGEHRTEEWVHLEPPKTVLLSPCRPDCRRQIDPVGVPVGVSLRGTACLFGGHKPTFKTFNITYNVKINSISVVMNGDCQDVAILLKFLFTYRPDQGFAPIH